MTEQPEVVVASEVKTAAESAVKQACTVISGLLHDCQFSSVENKNRRNRGMIQIAHSNNQSKKRFSRKFYLKSTR